MRTVRHHNGQADGDGYGSLMEAKEHTFHSRQLVICVSRIAEAPSDSSRSMIAITSPRRTITRTAHQPGSSRALTVGELKPGVTFSASGSLPRGMLYSKSE